MNFKILLVSLFTLLFLNGDSNSVDTFDISEYYFNFDGCKYYLYDDGWEAYLFEGFIKSDVTKLPVFEVRWNHPAFGYDKYVSDLYAFKGDSLYLIGMIDEPGTHHFSVFDYPLFIGNSVTKFNKDYNLLISM